MRSGVRCSMSDSTNPPFAFEGAELLASALHAQLIARRRATFEHDLKNVIHGLLSGTELLGKALATTSARIPPAECLALLQQQLTRAQATLHGILDEVAPATAPSADIELAALLEECSHDLRHQLQRYELVMQVEPDLRVHAQHSRLKDAMLYTLLECMDHAPLRSRLTWSARREGDGAIAVELRHALKGTSSDAAFKLIATLLGSETARVDVTSDATERRVSIRLPLAVAARTSSGGTRLLIVDPNRDAADSLAMLLQLDGYDTQVAYDAASALRASSTHKPEVIVLDVDAPFDPAAVLNELRSIDPNVRIVGLGHAVEPQLKGIHAQLRKPLDSQALRRALA